MIFEYPVPGIDTAIRTLRPHARWALSVKSIIHCMGMMTQVQNSKMGGD